MASGTVQIEPLWRGKERAKALPAFHMFTGANNTGRFSHTGKATWLLSVFCRCFWMKQMWQKECCQPWNPLSVQLTHPRGSTSRQSLSCNGISSANIGQKVTSALQHLELWSSTSSESMSKQEYGYRQLLLCRIHCWIVCKTDSWNTRLACSNPGVLPAPQSIHELVQCKCKSDCSSGRCSCRAKDLPCTDMC